MTIQSHDLHSFGLSLYPYFKALHIIFIVTWFAGLFYVVRLFIYNTEAELQAEPARTILRVQFSVMIKRLWLGITWPSAVITLLLGPYVLYLYGTIQAWMWVKLFFVLVLYLYHLTLHKIYLDEAKGIFKYTSTQLRIWNEVATVFLVAIVMLVSVKSALSFVWGLLGLLAFVLVLTIAIRIYKKIREK